MTQLARAAVRRSGDEFVSYDDDGPAARGSPAPVRPRGPASILEARRAKAFALLDQGLSLREVGRRLGCAPSSVMRWRDARQRLGATAIKVRSAPGRQHRMSVEQARDLIRVLRAGARANGFPTNEWSTSRITALIGKRFGIYYHRDHVGRLLHRLGWHYEQPTASGRALGASAPVGWVPGPNWLQSWAFRKPS